MVLTTLLIMSEKYERVDCTVGNITNVMISNQCMYMHKRIDWMILLTSYRVDVKNQNKNTFNLFTVVLKTSIYLTHV